MLYMGVTASVDVVIIRLYFVFKTFCKRNTIYIYKRAMVVSLPVDEVTASTSFFPYCTLKLFRVFTHSFVI